MRKNRTHPEEGDPKHGRRFIALIVLFNWLGFSFIAAGVTYVDARLTTHYYGVRHYRWGYWVAALGGLVVLLATLVFLRLANSLPRKETTSRRLKTVLPFLVLCVAGAASLPFFGPPFPHGEIASWIFYLSIVSLSSCGIHYSTSTLPKNWLTSSDLSEEIKLERVRQYVNHWRTLAVTITAGYLAMLIPWTTFLWTHFPAAYVTNPAERVRLSYFGTAGLLGLSLYVAIGIVYEAFLKANEAADLLLRVKSTNS